MSKLDAVTFSFDCCHLAGRFDDVKHKKADPSHGDRPSAEPESPLMTFFRTDYHGTDYYIVRSQYGRQEGLDLHAGCNSIYSSKQSEGHCSCYRVDRLGLAASNVHNSRQDSRHSLYLLLCLRHGHSRRREATNSKNNIGANLFPQPTVPPVCLILANHNHWSFLSTLPFISFPFMSLQSRRSRNVSNHWQRNHPYKSVSLPGDFPSASRGVDFDFKCIRLRSSRVTALLLLLLRALPASTFLIE